MKNLAYVFIFALCFSNAFAQNGWTFYSRSNSGLGSDTVTSIYIENNGTYWFGTETGVTKYDGTTWTNYNSNNSSILYPDCSISAIIKVKGMYYFGGSSGLVKYDGNKTWNTILGNGNFVSSIDSDNTGNLWIGTNNGVIKYDGMNTVIYNSSNSSLPTNYVRAIKKDNNGNIWAACLGGIVKFNGSNWQLYNSASSTLTSNNAYAITMDKKGNLWFSSDSLCIYKYNGTSWSRYNLSNKPSSNYFTCLTVDSASNIWGGIFYGPNSDGIMYKFDGNNVTRYMSTSEFPDYEMINDLKIDKYNIKWVATFGGGLMKFNNTPSLGLLTLKGGDSLMSLSSYNIAWTSQFIDNVKIEYSTNNGSTWTTIISSTPAQGGIYSWALPVVAPYSNQCKVRISDAGNSNIFAESASTFTIYAKVAALAFSPDGGTKYTGTNVSITSNTDNANIYYTTDGSEPTQSSKKYSTPIYINKNITLKAKAFKADWTDSDTKASDYLMQVAKISFSPLAGSYNTPQQVSLSTITDSTVIYYTLDGTAPSTQSPIYNQSLNIGTTTTIKAQAFRNNFTASQVTAGSFTINPAVITPVITASSGWLDSGFNGYAEGSVDGSQSSITYGNISSYLWTVNGDSAASGPQAKLKLNTGTNRVTLILTGPKADTVRRTQNISVFASKLNTNGSIYSGVAQLDNNTFFVTSADDKVYQFDSLGTVNWNILTGGNIQSTTCISDQDNIYAGSTDTRLYCFDKNGNPNWDKAMGGVITSSPSAGSNGIVYVGISTGRLYAVDATGKIKWNVQTGGAIASSPSVSLDGNIYFGSCDKKLYSVTSDGKINWTFLTGDSIFSSPAIGNDSGIVFGSNDGYVYKLNPNGNIAWSYYAGGKIKSSPIILSNGEVVFGSSNNKIICLDKNGSILWNYTTNAAVNGTAAISANGQILIGNDNGTLYSLSEQGNRIWYFNTNYPIESPVLITDNNLAIFGNMNGEVYTLKLNSFNMKKVAQSDYEWPTFKGDNKRTGNKYSVITAVKEDKVKLVKEYKLLQNYPNPFNPGTNITFSLEKPSDVTLSVYNILGQKVATVVNNYMKEGSYTFRFDAGNLNLASGIYIYRITAGTFVSSKKMILMK